MGNGPSNHEDSSQENLFEPLYKGLFTLNDGESAFNCAISGGQTFVVSRNWGNEFPQGATPDDMRNLIREGKIPTAQLMETLLNAASPYETDHPIKAFLAGYTSEGEQSMFRLREAMTEGKVRLVVDQVTIRPNMDAFFDEASRREWERNLRQYGQQLFRAIVSVNALETPIDFKTGNFVLQLSRHDCPEQVAKINSGQLPEKIIISRKTAIALPQIKI